MTSINVNELAQKAIQAEIQTILTRPEFKEEIKKEYKSQLQAMVDGAEKRARFWAIVASLLVLGVITSLAAAEFLKVREKRLSLDEDFSKIQIITSQLRESVTTIKADTERLKADLDSRDRTVRATIASLEKSVHEIELQAQAAISTLPAKR